MTRLALVGDVGLSDSVCEPLRSDLAAGRVPAHVELLRGADLTFVNLELPLMAGARPPEGVRTVAPARNADLLQALGVDVACLANNHIMDLGPAGLDETLDRLRGLGVRAFGAGGNLAEAAAPLVLETGGRTVGFLGFVEGRPSTHRYIATAERPGAAPLDRELIEKAVSSLRSRVDVLVVSLHGGLNYVHYASPRQREFARCAADAGADLVIGHHPHVLQGHERMNGTTVFHSLGEFLWDPGVGNVVEPRWDRARRRTAILELSLGPENAVEHRFVPFHREDDFRLRALDDAEESEFQGWMREISDVYRDYDPSIYLDSAGDGVVQHVFKVIRFHLKRGNVRYLAGLLTRIRPRHLRIGLAFLTRPLRRRRRP